METIGKGGGGWDVGTRRVKKEGREKKERWGERENVCLGGRVR